MKCLVEFVGQVASEIHASNRYSDVSVDKEGRDYKFLLPVISHCGHGFVKH